MGYSYYEELLRKYGIRLGEMERLTRDAQKKEAQGSRMGQGIRKRKVREVIDVEDDTSKLIAQTR